MRSSVITKLTVAIVSVFLILFAIYTAYSSWMTWQNTKETQEKLLLTSTELSAAEIKETFKQAFEMLEAESLAIRAQYEAGNLTGDFIINLKRHLMAENEFLLSNSSIFEPGVVQAPTPSALAFLDDSDRYVPYFIRDGAGLIEVKIEDYLQEEWYIKPILNGETMLVDPYDYEVNGQTISMVSLVVPVTSANNVIGYVSADFSLEFLKTLVSENAQPTGLQRVLSGGGLVAADSANQELVGQPIDSFTSEAATLVSAVQSNEIYTAYTNDSILAQDVYEIAIPIQFDNIDTNWTVLSAIPTKTMFAPLWSALLNSIITAIVMAALLAGTVYFIVRLLLKPLVPLRESLAKAATGDLTVSIDESNLANDEIGSVTKAYNHMLHQTREAVTGVLVASSDIQRQTATATSSILSVHSGLENSNYALSEIAQGAQHQSEVMEQSVQDASSLSNKIDNIQEMSSSMREQVNESLSESSAGMEQISNLKQQQQQTNEVNVKLTSQMQQLLHYVDDINRVMDTIKSISEQTNLLALNASIEAARAGEAGMGFAVVAQQVRLLAEQSHAETSAIQQTINAIRHASNETATFVQESSKLIEEQSSVIAQTEQVFTTQTNRSEQLEQQLLHLVSDLTMMTEQKNKMLNSMHTIASISEQSAAATEEVSSTANMQMSDVDNIKENIQQLEKISQQLATLMHVFKVQN